MRRGVLVSLMVGCVAMGGASAAQAATTVGQAAPDTATVVTCGGNAEIAQTGVAVGTPGYSSPVAGVITKFRIRSLSPDPTSQYRLKTFIPTGDPSIFTVGARSDFVTLPTPGVNEFATRLPIEVGTVLGIYEDGFGSNCGYLASSQDDIGQVNFNGDTAPGSNVQFGVVAPQSRLNIEADVEPDADGDGYGDETQDQCPSQSATQGPCDLPPVAMDDTPTVAEDSGATTIDVLANDTDDGVGTKTVDSFTQPDHGTVTQAPGGSLSYEPDADYCNDQAGTTDDFDYTLNGGSTATVSVTVTCADDAPVAVGDSRTVDQDSAAASIDVLANDTDVDGGAKQVTAAAQPAHGAVVVAADGTSLSFRPAAGYCNTQSGGVTDDFTYTVNGGSQAAVRISVRCAQRPSAPAVQQQAPPAAVAPRDTIAPVITSASLSSRVFAVDTGAKASAVARGTKLTVRLSEAATVIFVTEQKVGRRWRKVRIFGPRLPAGVSTIDYSGKIKPRGKQRALKPGRYRIRMRPSDRAGNRGVVSTVAFRITR